ncbi:MAG: HlyD family secretion protein [Pseudomonadota bacterium]
MTMVCSAGRVVAAALCALLASCQRAEAPPGFNGYAEAEFTRVAAPLSGRLVLLNVQRGAQVPAGAALFTLEREAEEAALREALAREQRSEALARDVRKGQRRDELAAAQAAVDAAQAALLDAERELQRQRALAAQGFVSGADLDALQARRDADAARVRQLQAQLRAARLGAREDAQAAALAEAQAASAAVAQVRWRVEQKSVQAPVAAHVEDTLYRPGEWVNAGAPVVTLLEPAALKLRFYVPQARLAEVKPGAAVKVRCDGCGAPINATVRRVASQPEFTPPVIYSKDNRARLVFLVEAWPSAQDARRLHPGQPVDVTPALQPAADGR